METTINMVRTRPGEEDAQSLRERWRHEVAIAIQRRKATMMRAVLPGKTKRQHWMACGVRDIVGSSGQLPPLEKDEDLVADDEAALEAMGS